MIDISNVSVAIGMPIAKASGVPPATAMSLSQTMYTSGQNGLEVVPIFQRAGSAVIGRDRVATTFLKATECDKLFWIDSDMVFTPADFFKMVALSTLYDVVGCSYSAKSQRNVRFQGLWPDKMVQNEHGLIKVTSFGLGFTVVDRKVLEKLAEGCSEYENGGVNRYAMFRMSRDGELRTEDTNFFTDVADLGYDVWLNPNIELGHVGEFEWRGKFADALKKEK